MAAKRKKEVFDEECRSSLKEFLKEVMQNTDEKTMERIKAAELLGKATGAFDNKKEAGESGKILIEIKGGDKEWTE